MTLSIGKILAVFVVVAILFGYKKLPELGKGLGESIRNFRKGLGESGEIDITPDSAETQTEQNSPTQTAIEPGPLQKQTAAPPKRPAPLRRPIPGGKPH